MRIQRILSGGDTRSTSEASASIRKISVRKKTRRRWNEHGLYGYNGFYQRCYLILDLLRIAFAPIRRGMPPARDNPWQSQRPTGANKSNNTKKNPWKNRSVASALSVIVFEHGERAKGEQAHQWGTVFQTALLLFLLVIPRLRPGLLSLRSVLSSRQNLLQTTNMERSAGFQTKLITNYKHGV